MAGKRNYVIQNHPPRFWAGVLPNGQQVLVGPMLPNIVAYQFSNAGELLGREIVPLTNPLDWDATVSRYVHRPGFNEELESEVQAILDRLEFSPSKATVQSFFDEQQSIGVLDFPSDYSAFLEDPSHADNEDEADDFRESIAEWESQGRFVLVWGSELWMNEQGKLIAS